MQPTTTMEDLNLTSDNFDREVLESEAPVLVDFWQHESSSELLDELAGQYADQVKIAKLNVAANPEFSQRFRIAFLPTFLFFKAGQLIYRVVGLASKPELALRLESLLGPVGR